MLQDEVVALEDDRVRVSHSPGLSVVVEEPHTTVPAGRHRVEVRYALEVSAPDAGGTLMITTLSRGDLLLTALVGVGNHYELLPESGGQGSVRTFTLEVARGEARRLVVIEHPADLAPELLPGLLPEPDDLWRREPVPPTQAEHSRGTRARPPRVDEPLGGAEGGPFPEAAAPEAPAPEAPPPEEVAAEAAAPEEAAPEEAAARRSPPTAAPGAPPSPVQAVLAEVGANMPSAVHLDDTVPVEVLLSREEVTIFGGTSHDEQVIVMDPDRPLDVVLLRRGFDLDDRELPHETGRRSLSLPAVGEPAVRVVFWLRAAQEGEGEVQVVVRQDAPQPLATLRLTATVLPPSAAPADRASAQADLEARSQGLKVPLAGRVTPFLNPRSLVIDENLVGGVSELSFDLVLPHVRRRFTRVVRDKTAVLKEVFRRLDVAWRDIKPLEDPQARSRAFHDSLRALGSWLALEVLPPELLDDLRHHLDDIDELAVITSGETDIPWELVHVWDPDDGDDPDGRGFLGRMGLVRWVYNTGHPTELSVRAGRAHYLIPAYVDPTLALEQTQLEPTYLKPFGATAIEPPDATGIARLITSGQVDLLHFAGHGFSNDTDVPAVREMVLADYRPGVVSVAGADRSRVAFGLEDLRGALPDSPFADPGPLVFLNACRIGEAPSTRSEVGGFAETFLRGGAGAFVGCLWSVGDQPAREFVAAFYEALDSGHTIAEATLAARRAAREAGDISWLAYTVYAHPDARLADRPLPPPDTDPSSKGTVMTTTEAARSVPDLTREELRAIHPFVVCMEDGRLAEGPSQLPVGVDDFHTVTADIDELFTKRVPDFITMHGKPVPMVLWAHGGLVDKATGLRVAHTQVAWWQANGVFPVHFVWRTGLAESLWDAVKDSLPGRARGLDDVFDTLIEAAVRGAHGKDVWGAMKTTAKLASEKDKGGAWYFAQRLAEFQAANPGSVTVHAAGHSAGSIFHSYLIPQVLAAGVGEIASLNLLAPAIRVDEFKQRILKKSVVDRIRRLNLFTMTEAFEKDDTCLGIYHKSLLYLIRGALEDEPRAEILGLQECLQRDKDLAVLLGKAGSGAKGEVMWSRTVNGGPRTSSLSTSHGGFDNDAATMNSLARRVLDNDQLTAGFGTVAGTRGLAEDASPWPSEEDGARLHRVTQGSEAAAQREARPVHRDRPVPVGG